MTYAIHRKKGMKTITRNVKKLTSQC